MNNTEIWLERLNSLFKSELRQAVTVEGIQSVHFEILRYLSICNHYSNTAQALVEYLGQTKGSISQSLKLMEKSGYVERKASKKDKRVSKLFLTKKGKSLYKRISEKLVLYCEDSPEMVEAIKSLLVQWQTESGKSGFGQCKSCRYNTQLKNGEFQCGLTGEPLSNLDILNICREHEFLAGSIVQ